MCLTVALLCVRTLQEVKPYLLCLDNGSSVSHRDNAKVCYGWFFSSCAVALNYGEVFRSPVGSLVFTNKRISNNKTTQAPNAVMTTFSATKDLQTSVIGHNRHVGDIFTHIHYLTLSQVEGLSDCFQFQCGLRKRGFKTAPNYTTYEDVSRISFLILFLFEVFRTLPHRSHKYFFFFLFPFLHI